MITRNDEKVLPRWFRRHHHLFKRIAVVDGSDGDLTQREVTNYDNVVYLRDPLGPITDQTLRAHGWRAIRDGVALGDWVMSVHPDEFHVHDPRFFMDSNYDVVTWKALHILPHTSELSSISPSDFDPIRDCRHYWYKMNGDPTFEGRMWRVTSDIAWDEADPRPSSYSIPRSHVEKRRSPHQPIHIHYKLLTINDDELGDRGERLSSRLNTGLHLKNGRKVGDGFDESNPYGHKEFVRCSDDWSFREFDDFQGRMRLSGDWAS